ncbi:MAG: hypothetical protein QXG55_03865 [Thermoplasmata archaeon]
MQDCNNCKYGAKCFENFIVCINRNSREYGKLMSKPMEKCANYVEGIEIISISPYYLWCETCQKTIFPEIELNEHINHEVYIDKDLEDILEYSDIILYGAD